MAAAEKSGLNDTPSVDTTTSHELRNLRRSRERVDGLEHLRKDGTLSPIP